MHADKTILYKSQARTTIIKEMFYKMGAAGCDKVSNSIEFHSREEASKKQCLKALID